MFRAAFVSYFGTEQAEEALARLDGTTVGPSMVQVSFARRQEPERSAWTEQQQHGQLSSNINHSPPESVQNKRGEFGFPGPLP